MRNKAIGKRVVPIIPDEARTFGMEGFFNALGIYSASCACGLQNAMVSTYSGAVVRTTHLSGMFTDLGIFLGHYLRRLPVDRRRLSLCFLIISGFLCGGIFGSAGFRHFGYTTLYVPASLAAVTACAYALYRMHGRKNP